MWGIQIIHNRVDGWRSLSVEMQAHQWIDTFQQPLWGGGQHDLQVLEHCCKAGMGCAKVYLHLLGVQSADWRHDICQGCYLDQVCHVPAEHKNNSTEIRILASISYVDG